MASLQEKCDLIDKYIKHRLASENDEIISMCTSDVVMISSRDGTFTGSEEFKKYLDANSPTGVWEKAVAGDDDELLVNGSVKVFFIPVSVKARFWVREEGDNLLIYKITVGRS